MTESPVSLRQSLYRGLRSSERDEQELRERLNDSVGRGSGLEGIDWRD